jgi:hypothetical protein
VGRVTVAVVRVVDVVLVRHGHVPAALAVLVVVALVGGVAGAGALVDVALVGPVKVPVVRVVGVVAVRKGDVSTTLAVGVGVTVVSAVLGGGGHVLLLIVFFEALEGDVSCAKHGGINI